MNSIMQYEDSPAGSIGGSFSEMMSDTHSRDSSASSSFSSSMGAGASYHLVLEHVLTSSGVYDLPLMTNYSLQSPKLGQHSNPTSPTRSRANSSPLGSFPSPYRSAPIEDVPESARTATARFVSALMNHVARLPSQPSALSPLVMTSFVRRCFPRELELVDFPQSLIALTFLKHLEDKRRQEITSALLRVGYEPNATEEVVQQMQIKNPGVANWASAIHEKVRKTEPLYQQVYITLRRWILINEMSLKPFNSYNVLAMINTLFPVEPEKTSSSPLPARIMLDQREAYFKYAKLVERKGCIVLEHLMQLGRPADSTDMTGWPNVSRTLDAYLRQAMTLINECGDIRSPEDFDCHGLKSARITGLRRRRNGELGLLSVHQPSPSRPGHVPARSVPLPSAQHKRRPILPSSPLVPQSKRGSDPEGSFNTTPPLKLPNEIQQPLTSRFSALESIARKVRNIRDRRKAESKCEKIHILSDESEPSTCVSSMATSPSSTFSNASSKQGLRRLKSLGDIKDNRRKSIRDHERATGSPEPFDVEAMVQRRQLWQAAQERRVQSGPQPRFTPSFEI